jgi:sulfur transfer protein SufE
MNVALEAGDHQRAATIAEGLRPEAHPFRGCQAMYWVVVVSKRDGTIVFDPHVTGACVLTLAEDVAVALRDALTEWLG